MIIPPGYTEVIVQFGVASSSHTSTCQWAWQGVVNSDADCAAIFDLLDTSGIPEVLATDWKIIGVECSVGQDGGDPLVYQDTGEFVGDSGAASVPQAAVIVRKRTSTGGRKGRGRIYQPGVPEGLVSPAGTLQSDYVIAVKDAWENWIEAVSTSVDVDLTLPVLLHSDETAPSPIFALSVNPRCGTQRRRNSAN